MKLEGRIIFCILLLGLSLLHAKEDSPCDFESADICGFITDSPDGVIWKRVQAAKFTVGPIIDKTFGTNEGHYMIVQPSLNARVPGENNAYLIVPNIPSTEGKSSCLRFWYQMQGRNVISLEIYIRPPRGQLPLFSVWSHTSKHGNTWKVGQITIDAPYTHEVVFEAITERGSDGYIALDDVRINDGRCPAPGSCDFEKDLCTWQNAESGVDVEWIRNSGPTPTNLTGPDVDRTLGTAEGSYIYLQAGNPVGRRNLVGVLESEFFYLSTDRCLSFWAHMNGAEMGTLMVNLTNYNSVKNGAFSKKLWIQSTEQGPEWFNRRLSLDGLDAEDEYQILFIGKTKGILSDIALDDIDVTSGICYEIQDDPFDCKDDTFEGLTDGCVKKACSFTNKDLCGWRIFYKTNNATRSERDSIENNVFRWIPIQAHDNNVFLNKQSRPARDHTSNSTEGWYLLADGAPGRQGDITSLVSPIITFTHTRCVLDFWVYCGHWSGILNVYSDIVEDGKLKSELLWKSDRQLDGGRFASKWIHAKTLLGRRKNFKVRLETVRPYTYSMAISLDDIIFESCPLPPFIPPMMHVCPSNHFACYSTRCIEMNLVCDYSDDCLDYSDESEIYCSQYRSRCSFEDGLCVSWSAEPDGFARWLLYNGRLSSSDYSPTRDHTTGSPKGKFLTVISSYNILEKKAKIHSDTIDGVSTNCVVRVWYNVIGSSHKLNVYQRTSYSSEGMHLLRILQSDVPDFWHRAEINTNGEGKDFQVVFEADLARGSGSISIDDISLTPGCRLVDRNISGKPTEILPSDLCGAEKLACKNGMCYTHVQRCNFINDCGDGTDEADCGTGCDFEAGTCGWYNPYGLVARWNRVQGRLSWFGGPLTDHTLQTAYGFYLAARGRQQEGEVAEIRTKTYVASGSGCKISLWYFLDGKDAGSLSLLLRHSKISDQHREIWKLSGSQGSQWQQMQASINSQQNFAVIIRAKYGKSYLNFAAIDDIEFTHCEPLYPALICTSTQFMCLDKRQCINLWTVCDGKYDCADKSDEYKCEKHAGDCDFDSEDWLKDCQWTIMVYSDFLWQRANASHSSDTGPHSNYNRRKDGYYLFVNSSQQTEGQRAAIGTPLFRASEGKCYLRFWYYMKGSDKMGRLEVLTEGDQGQVNRLWSRSNPQADDWIYGITRVDNSQDYRVVFIGVVGGDNLTDIAIDEVSFTSGCLEGGTAILPTGTPPPCTLGEFTCVQGSVVCIPAMWRCDCVYDCEDGSDEHGCGNCRSTEAPTTTPILVLTSTSETYPETTLTPKGRCNHTQKLCTDEKTCIPGILLCDGVPDCPDGSDEAYCPGELRCEEGYYFCQDKMIPPCLHRERICDGKYDCSDGSDESLCGVCPKEYCQNKGICSQKDKVPVCKCPPGYKGNRCLSVKKEDNKIGNKK